MPEMREAASEGQGQTQLASRTVTAHTAAMGIAVSRLLISALTMTLAAACHTAPTARPNAPCFDGWTTDESGKSKVWTPDEAEALALRAINPTDEAAVCYHLMPSGRVIVLTDGIDVIHTYQATPISGGYALTSSGSVVWVH